MFVITGGGSGIGQALAQALCERAEAVLIVGRNQTRLEQAAASHALMQYLVCDLSTEAGRSILKNHCASLSPIKGLINNAGTLGALCDIRDLSLADWRQTMATNVEAVFALSQAFYPLMPEGRVLNIGSGAAYFPIKAWSAYCVSKAALSMLTRCWQLEADKVYFASVMPGIVDTPMQQEIREASAMTAEKQQFFIDLKNKSQLVQPETLADFLCWLLLDIDSAMYQSQEWDIYDTSHHAHWLKPTSQVPPLE